MYMFNAIFQNVRLIKVKVLNETLIGIDIRVKREVPKYRFIVSYTSQLYIFNLTYRYFLI